MNARRIERCPRVLVAAPEPFYEDRGTPIALRYLLRALAESGYQVDLITFPIGADVAVPGLRILRLPNPLHIRRIPIGFSWRKLSLDLSMRVELVRRLATGAYACVHAVEEAAYLASGPCRRAGVPLVYDMASSIPEQLREHPLFAPAHAWLRALERRVLSSADFVVCSRGLAAHVRQIAPECRVEEWAFPMLDPFACEQAVAELCTRLALPAGSRPLVYTGSFADYQGLDVLIEALPRILAQCSEVALVLVGGTAAECARLRARVTRVSRDAVRIVEREPRSAMPTYAALAEVLLSPRARGANAPLKIFDYLRTAKPILASRGAAHAPFELEPGVTLFEHSPDGFARAALAVLCGSEQPGVDRPRAPSPPAEWATYRAQVHRVYAAVLGERAGA